MGFERLVVSNTESCPSADDPIFFSLSPHCDVNKLLLALKIIIYSEVIAPSPTKYQRHHVYTVRAISCCSIELIFCDWKSMLSLVEDSFVFLIPWWRIPATSPSKLSVM